MFHLSDRTCTLLRCVFPPLINGEREAAFLPQQNIPYLIASFPRSVAYLETAIHMEREKDKERERVCVCVGMGRTKKSTSVTSSIGACSIAYGWNSPCIARMSSSLFCCWTKSRQEHQYDHATICQCERCQSVVDCGL